MPKFKNLDANEGVFFQRELESVRSQMYDVKYPQLKIANGTIIPILSESGPGAETTVYRQFDQVGVAKLIANYATDLPRVDIKGKEFRHPIKSGGGSYGWNIQEVRAAAKANRPLSASKAKAGRRAMMQLVDSIGFGGDAETGLVGFNQNGNMSEVTLPNDGSSSSTTLASKTPDQMIRDLNSIANKPYIVTNEVEFADTLLVSQNIWTLISTTPRAANSDLTVLQMFLRNQEFVKTVLVLPRMATAGAGSSERIISYRRDPEAVQYDVPILFEEFAVETRGLEFIVPFHARIGSVIFPYPLAMAYADNC